MNANHVQCGLGRLPANRLAVAWEAHPAFFHATRVCKSDINRPHWLFLRSASGSRNPRDAHSERAAYTAPDSLRERDRYFRADRALGLDKFRRNPNPRRFQLVAVADNSSKKIGRAARDARQPLRQQSASAAFRRRDSRAVHCQFRSNYFFESRPVLAENAVRQRELEAFHDFVQSLLGMLRRIRPHAKMDLRLSW